MSADWFPSQSICYDLWGYLLAVNRRYDGTWGWTAVARLDVNDVHTADSDYSSEEDARRGATAWADAQAAKRRETKFV